MTRYRRRGAGDRGKNMDMSMGFIRHLKPMLISIFLPVGLKAVALLARKQTNMSSLNKKSESVPNLHDLSLVK